MGMNSPTLVIMAAGMGSRFGGLKQIEPVDDRGHLIIDFSLFDAYRAGFRRVVFIIKEEIDADFRELIGSRTEKYFSVGYAYQRLDALPEGFSVPSGRVKPWGTAHALLCAKEQINGPFAVINADDYYGASAFERIFEYLSCEHAENEHAMVAYRLSGTLSESGHVARGICEVENGLLKNITERTHIEKREGGAVYTEDGESFFPLSGDTLVSMNFWGFGRGILERVQRDFPRFLEERLPLDPLKCEYFLPDAAQRELKNGGIIRVLECDEQWYGVTYRSDLASVVEALSRMKKEGKYPEGLWQ